MCCSELVQLLFCTKFMNFPQRRTVRLLFHSPPPHKVIHDEDAIMVWKGATEIRERDMSKGASPSRGKRYGMFFSK